MTEKGSRMFEGVEWMTGCKGQQGWGWGGWVSCFFSALTPSYSTRRLIQFLCKAVFICMFGMITFAVSNLGAAGNKTKSLKRMSQTYSPDIVPGTYFLLMH